VGLRRVVFTDPSQVNYETYDFFVRKGLEIGTYR